MLFEAELKLVVCDDSEKALQLMKTKSSLEFIILIEPINENARNKANELHIKLYTFEQLKQMGRDNLKPPQVSELFKIKTKS